MIPLMFSWDTASCARWRCAVLLLACLLGSPPLQAAPGSVQLDELTWTEVRDALRAGTTTVIIPVGGSEQNGPHMALGKHNVRAGALASRIATKLGNTLVAPVVAYVPEGQVSPPLGHMRFPGTISVPQDAFAAVLAGAARSLRQHGFVDIVLIGDSGNYQNVLKDVAQRLNREWAATPARAHYVAAYYHAASDEFAQALRSRGISDQQIGTHAGLADTSLLLAIDASRVRGDQMRATAAAGAESGVAGDPRQASAALGQLGVDLVIDRTVAAIRQAIAGRRPGNK
jgi:creatinine amidohydrolase